MDIIQVSFADVEFKADADSEGEFSGYGSIFGNKDGGKDICVKGCFSESLTEMSNGTEARPLMFWMHKQDEPIGEWKMLAEDDKGLRAEGKLWIKQGIPRAEQAYRLLKSKQGGLSIGFKVRPNGQSYDERKGARLLTKLALKELSVVTLPMNDKARVLVVKGAESDLIEPGPSPELLALQSKLKESAEANALALVRHNLRDGAHKFQTMDSYLRGKTKPLDRSVEIR